MNDNKEVESFRNKSIDSKINYSTHPKTYYNNTDNNNSTFETQNLHSIITSRDFKPRRLKIRNYNFDTTPRYNSVTEYNKSFVPNNYLLKTIKPENRFFSSYEKNKKKFLKLKNNSTLKSNNKSESVSLKILNDFFKPERERDLIYNRYIFKPRILNKKNYSNDFKKTTSTNNNLSYYFPNLFNFSYSKIISPDKNLDKSTFLFKNLKELNFDEEITDVSSIKNNFFNKFNNGFFLSEINNSSIKNKPIFIEREFTYDILKNLRFKFKGPFEKGKFKNYVNSFNKTTNLKFNNY